MIDTASSIVCLLYYVSILIVQLFVLKFPSLKIDKIESFLCITNCDSILKKGKLMCKKKMNDCTIMGGFFQVTILWAAASVPAAPVAAVLVAAVPSEAASVAAASTASAPIAAHVVDAYCYGCRS
jgi:hypothetical protein